jgi:hypothetical protein
VTYASGVFPPPAYLPPPPPRRRWPWNFVWVAAAVIAVLGWVAYSHHSTAPVNAQLGQPIAFTLTSGGSLTITVNQIVAPATAAPYQTALPPGEEYAGVQITVDNTGTTNAFIDEGPQTALEDSSGTSYGWTPVTLSDCAPLGNDGMATLAAGGSTSGCITFEVPYGDTFTEVSMGSSGQAPGVWNVG